MDYKELVERLNEWNENLISKLCADDVLTCDDLCGCTGDCIVAQAATAITDLLARAEAAEARCETLEKMVKEYQDTIVPGYRGRAEKAEREAKEAQREVTLCRNGWKKAETESDAAVADLRLVSDCRTCGNVTPWCIENPDKCKGWKWRGKKEE